MFSSICLYITIANENKEVRYIPTIILYHFYNIGLRCLRTAPEVIKYSWTQFTGIKSQGNRNFLLRCKVWQSRSLCRIEHEKCETRTLCTIINEKHIIIL